MGNVTNMYVRSWQVHGFLKVEHIDMTFIPHRALRACTEKSQVTQPSKFHPALTTSLVSVNEVLVLSLSLLHSKHAPL